MFCWLTLFLQSWSSTENSSDDCYDENDLDDEEKLNETLENCFSDAECSSTAVRGSEVNKVYPATHSGSSCDLFLVVCKYHFISGQVLMVQSHIWGFYF